MARIFDASTGTRPTGWSITRSSVAAYVNSSGVLASAAANTERVNYTTGGALLGLLVEPSSANQTFDSNNLTTANWNRRGTASVTSGQTGPDGASSASLLSGIVGAGNDVYSVTGTFPANGTRGEPSLWIKRVSTSGTLAVLNTYNEASGTWLVNLALLGSGWEYITRSHPAVTVSIEYTVTGGGMALYFRSNDATSLSFYVSRCQIENSRTTSTSSITTTTAAVTRAADAYSFTLASGATQLTFTFDDASTQVVTGLTGGSTYNIPTTLSRPNVLYIDDNASGASTALTASSIATGSPVIGSPTAASSQALTASGIATAAAALGAPALGQTHILTGATLASGAPVLGTPALGQTHILTASVLTTASPSIGTPAAAQTSGFIATPIVVGAPVIGSPAIGQIHVLIAAPVAPGAAVLGSPSLGQTHNLSAAPIITAAPYIGAPTDGSVSLGGHYHLLGVELAT